MSILRLFAAVMDLLCACVCACKHFVCVSKGSGCHYSAVVWKGALVFALGLVVASRYTGIKDARCKTRIPRIVSRSGFTPTLPPLPVSLSLFCHLFFSPSFHNGCIFQCMMYAEIKCFFLSFRCVFVLAELSQISSFLQASHMLCTFIAVTRVGQDLCAVRCVFVVSELSQIFSLFGRSVCLYRSVSYT